MPRHPTPWQWKGRTGWYARIKGRVIRLGDTKTEAHQRLSRILSGTEPSGSSAKGLTTHALCAEFATHGTSSLAPLTQQWYARHLDSFREACGQISALEIKPLDVTRWLNGKSWKDTTRRGAVTAVKRAFRWAHRQGLLDVNPLELLERPAGERRQAVLTPAQARAVVEAYPAGDPWRAFLEALRETGCRPGELAGLTARDVNLEAGTWTVANKTRRATREPTRTVYLTPVMLEVSRRLLLEQPSGPIFRNARGGAWTRNAMACRFARLRAKLEMGPEATAYSFRHDYVTEALERGVPIATVAELIGHSSVVMIQRVYSRLSERRQYLRTAAGAVRPAVVDAAPAPADVPAPPARQRTRPGKAPRRPR